MSTIVNEGTYILANVFRLSLCEEKILSRCKLRDFALSRGLTL